MSERGRAGLPLLKDRLGCGPGRRGQGGKTAESGMELGEEQQDSGETAASRGYQQVQEAGAGGLPWGNPPPGQPGLAGWKRPARLPSTFPVSVCCFRDLLLSTDSSGLDALCRGRRHFLDEPPNTGCTSCTP